MVYIPSPDVVSTQLDDSESVLLNLKTRKYFTINQTGSFIWNGLKDGKTVEEIATMLTEEFDIDSDGARNHVEKFLEQLLVDGIVTEG